MKYIDADKLKEEIDKRYREYRTKYRTKGDKYYEGMADSLDYFEQFIDSLQQKQPDFPTTDEQVKEFLATHPKIKVPEKYKNPDWLFKKQEQSEVNLEKETKKWWKKHLGLEPEKQLWMDAHQSVVFARHFYELGLKARKK